MNNVLIIGNGFDRQLGLNTDYISFLDWVEDKGDYVEPLVWKFIKNEDGLFGINENDYVTNLNKHEKLLKNEIEYEKTFPSPNVFRLLEWEKSLKAMSFAKLNKSNIVRVIEEAKKSNLWFSYFNYLRKEYIENSSFSNKEKVGKNGEWIDLETLIELNIRENFGSNISSSEDLNIYTFSKLMYDDNYNDETIYEKLWQDFKELKKLLAEYILSQNVIFNNHFQNISGLPFLEKYQFDKIINFNYTNFFLDIHINDNFRENKISLKEIYNVHGVCADKEKIVFGFDSFFPAEKIVSEGKSQLELDLLRHKELSKYTKIQQLLTLQVEKEKFEIGIVDKLSILGHSIGEQDYNYFFSIMDNNIDKIEIEYLWYKYNNNKEFNNRDSGQEALFNMINAYEKYANKRVFHKMIFEGRIKFKEVNIPKII